MPDIEDIKKNLTSYKAVLKRQGDFTLYASKYIQDVEVLLRMVKGSTGSSKPGLPGVDPVVRKKKRLTKTTESTD